MLSDLNTQTLTSIALQLRGAMHMLPSVHAPLEIIGVAMEPLLQGQVY